MIPQQKDRKSKFIFIYIILFIFINSINNKFDAFIVGGAIISIANGLIKL